jgi:predicted nucleic acid-binding protein
VRLILDTTVLIDHLRGRREGATSLLSSAVSRGDELWSSLVVQAELLAGMRQDEEAATRRLIGAITWVEVDAAAAEDAGALGRRYLRSHPGIDIADLILAALAQRLGADLKTTNVKRFPMFEGLEPPY